MTAKTLKVELCDECRFDGGWHYPEDATPHRPHHDQARQVEQARAMTVEANENAVQAGRLILRDVAATRHEFSANDTRELFDTAMIPDPLTGMVFRWAASDKATADGPLIEDTGRQVQSTEATTRHKLTVWRSLVHRTGRAA